jgi:HTH-type transcriptional regulator, quorum sensing regulator NprR
MIHVLQILRLLKQRNEKMLFERCPFGSAIKMRRKELGLTLEEVAKGICSVSLLSKIENNLVNASETYQALIAKRLGLKVYESSIDLNYENNKNIMIDALLNQDPFPIDIVESYGLRKDIQEHMIKMGYYVSIKNYDLAETFVNDIKTHLLQLLDDEVALFLFCIHKILYAQGHYYDAHQILINIPEKALKNEKIALLSYKGRLKNAFKLHMISEIIHSYDAFSKLCNELQYYHILNEVQVENLLFSATYRSPSQMRNQMDRMCRLDSKIADYVYAMSLYHHQEYESLKNYIESRECNGDAWFLLKLLAYDQLKLSRKLVPLLQEDLSDKCSNDLKIVHRHLRYKYIANSEDALNYLRREILGLKHLTDDYMILNYLLNDAQKMFSEKHFYKEAFQVSAVLTPKIKSLQKVKNHSEMLL